MAFVEQDEAEHLAKARHGLSERQGLGIVLFGRFEDKECQGAEPRVIRGAQREVDCNGLVDSRVVQPLNDACAMGFVRDLLADRGQGVLARRILDMRQECRAFAHEVRTAAQSTTGGTPLRRIDIGLGEHAATEQRGHLLGIDCVVFGLAAVESFPGESMAKNARNRFLSTQVSEPIPGEDTLDSPDQVVTIRCNGLEQWCRRGLHSTVQQHYALVVHDTHVHAPGMQVDPAVKLMLGVVQSHEVSPFIGNMVSHDQHTTVVC